MVKIFRLLTVSTLFIVLLTRSSCDNGGAEKAIPDHIKLEPFGKALELDGTDDVLMIPDHASLNFGTNERFTISALIKSNSTQEGRIFFKWAGNGYAIYWGDGGVPGRIDGVLWADSTQHYTSSEKTYHNNQWTHIAMVRSGVYFILYVNSVMETGILAPMGSLTNTSPLYIGANPLPGFEQFFEGSIDEVRIWDHARTPEQLRTYMASPLGPEIYSDANSGLLAYYCFDQLEDLGIGTPGTNDIRDLSVNENHGDLLGDASLNTYNNFSQPRLTLQFKGMGNYINKKFECRIIDMQSEKEVGRKSISSVSQTDFEFNMYTIIIGHRYYIQFYADQNSSGYYDAPPTDHAWQMSLNPAMGNDTITFEHHSNYTDIVWGPIIDSDYYSATWTVEQKDTATDVSHKHLATIHANFGKKTVQLIIKEDIDKPGPWNEYTFNGKITEQGDSLIIEPEAPLVKLPGVLDNLASLTQAMDLQSWSGSVQWDQSNISGDITCILPGKTTNISINGTLGQSQMIFDYQTGTSHEQRLILAQEDTILTKSDPSGIERFTHNTWPDQITLMQNFPNPFNPETTIRYYLPEENYIELSVYDCMGKNVVTLVKEIKSTGWHHASWNARNVDAGIYIYTLKTSGYLMTRKCLLIK